MATLHFSKGNLNNAIKLTNGQPVLFERSGENNGVIQLDDQTQTEIAALLNGFADARKMGVRRISPEHYEALKKKPQRARPVIQTSQPPVRSLNKESGLPKGLRTESKKSSPVAAPVSTTPLQLKPSAALLALKEEVSSVPTPAPVVPVSAPAPTAEPAATEPPKPTGPKTKVAKAKKSTVKLEPKGDDSDV